MKNKNKTIARNAIRIRNRKRKKEKPNGEGKGIILKRILPFSFALLLVASLFVVPAFADDAFQGSVTTDYYTNFLRYDIPDLLQSNTLFYRFIERYFNDQVSGASGDGLFGCQYLIYGKRTFNNESIIGYGFDFSSLDNAIISYPALYIEYIDMSILLNGQTDYLPTFSHEDMICTITIDVSDSGVVTTTITIKESVPDNQSYSDRLVFSNSITIVDNNVQNSGMYELHYYIDGYEEYSGQVSEIETVFTLKHTFVGTVNLSTLYSLKNLLLNDTSIYEFHPLAFANGYYGGKMTAPTYEEGFTDGHNAGYTEGKDEGFSDGLYQGFLQGEEQGYVNGFADGVGEGQQHGYVAGYEVGYQEGYLAGGNGNDEKAYKEGYDAAVAEIDSGDFGRNLLGSAFSAPFEALSDFTIVSWTTNNDDLIEISLGAVLSAVIGVGLFLWFLKLFAGG